MQELKIIKLIECRWVNSSVPLPLTSTTSWLSTMTSTRTRKTTSYTRDQSFNRALLSNFQVASLKCFWKMSSWGPLSKVVKNHLRKWTKTSTLRVGKPLFRHNWEIFHHQRNRAIMCNKQKKESLSHKRESTWKFITIEQVLIILINLLSQT